MDEVARIPSAIQVDNKPDPHAKDPPYHGACMSSSACQNPSLTYMALTARATDHAVAEMKNGIL